MKVEGKLPSETKMTQGEAWKEMVGTQRDMGSVFNTHAFTWNIQCDTVAYTMYTMKS